VTQDKANPFAVDKPILVIGDSCLDVIEEVESSRLSREEPIPVFEGEGPARTLPGCVGYVLEQLATLGAVVSEAPLNPRGRMMKTRFVAGSPPRQVFRLDDVWGSRDPAAALDLLCQNEPSAFSAALFVDYQGRPPEGVLLHALRDLDCPVVGDCRRDVEAWSDRFDILKCNAMDMPASSAGLPRSTTFVVTCGPQGHYVMQDNLLLAEAPAIWAGPVANVSGAGDVFSATMVAALASLGEIGVSWRSGIERAAELGGIAAGLRVSKPEYGATVSAAEIIEWERRRR